MNTQNPFLNALFNNLSSVYQKDEGMINSNLFIWFNACANVFATYSNMAQQTQNNTYLNLADTSALEANFSSYVNFPYPPRLNTVTNGGEIYRAILISIYSSFLNGSTEESMINALTTVLSFLTIDENTNTIMPDSNDVYLYQSDSQIQLVYPALSSSGTTAQPSDISIFPTGLVVTSYNPGNQIITFSGTVPASGQAYEILYFRDHSSQINTNWVNFTNPSGMSPLPTDLKTVVNTFRNPQFSYWWNTYNRSNQGVQIIDGTLNPSDVGLVWRLPEKYITFTDPYTNLATESNVNLYNLSGTIYDINNANKDSNPDYEQTTIITSYANQVSRNPNDFYVRYNENNNLFPALAPISGSLVAVDNVSDLYVGFTSSNFGALDFFQMGENFDIADIFGTGTKYVWTNVTNSNGVYSLNRTNFFERPFSLHENILFEEFF